MGWERNVSSHAEEHKKTSQVSNYMFLTPFLTSILGFLIAGEILEQSTVIGGVIILVGVFLFNYGERLKYSNNQ